MMDAVWTRALTVLLDEVDSAQPYLRGDDLLAAHELFGELIDEFSDVAPEDFVGHLQALGVAKSFAEDLYNVCIAVEHLLVGPKHVHWSSDAVAQITREAN